MSWCSTRTSRRCATCGRATGFESRSASAQQLRRAGAGLECRRAARRRRDAHFPLLDGIWRTRGARRRAHRGGDTSPGGVERRPRDVRGAPRGRPPAGCGDVRDLLAGKIDLDRFGGVVFAGGFSYADVLDSAKGWAATIRYNERLWAMFEAFRTRKTTFSLGVCNGCQLMALLGWVPGGEADGAPLPAEEQPRFVHNASGRFESRFSSVEAGPSPAVPAQGDGGLEPRRVGGARRGARPLPHALPLRARQGEAARAAPLRRRLVRDDLGVPVQPERLA